MESKDMQKKMEDLWKKMGKDFDELLRQSSNLVKKGEVFLKDTSKKGQIELEVISLSLQKEKLYYELGKTMGATPKKKDYLKKKTKIMNQIKVIDKKVKVLKRAR